MEDTLLQEERGEPPRAHSRRVRLLSLGAVFLVVLVAIVAVAASVASHPHDTPAGGGAHGGSGADAGGGSAGDASGSGSGGAGDGSGSSAAPPAGFGPVPAAIGALNDQFHVMYGAARDAAVASVAPVIMFGSSMKLYTAATEVAASPEAADARKPAASLPYTPTTYQEYKSICHVTLGIFTALYPVLEAGGVPGGNATETSDKAVAVDGTAMESLREMQVRIAFALGSDKDIPTVTFGNEELKAAHVRILEGSASFIAGIVASGTITGRELIGFARGIVTDVKASVRGAAQDQISVIIGNVKAWFDDGLLTADTWQDVEVVVEGSHMARAGYLVVQTMSYLMGGSGDPRIIYAEALGDHGALTLVGTHIVDGGAGAAFFDDQKRLHRDLLADATTDILAKMGPAPTPPITELLSAASKESGGAKAPGGGSGSHAARALMSGKSCPFSKGHR